MITKTERQIVSPMVHALLEEYVLYTVAFPIGLAISMGLSMIYLGRSGKGRSQAGVEHPLWQRHRTMLVAGLMRRTRVAGLLFIGIGLVVFGLILLVDVSTRGTLLNTWTLSFASVSAFVTLLFVFLMIVPLRQLERRLERHRIAASPNGEATPLSQAAKSRPQPKEAREE